MSAPYICPRTKIMAMAIFFIEVEQVKINPNKSGTAALHKKKVRGDLVIGVRSWDKSKEDTKLIGDKQQMCEVEFMDPGNMSKTRIRIAEDADTFSSRLQDESRNSSRHSASKQGS